MAGSLTILGVIGMIAQAAFLREIMATFRAGELTFGMAILFWLLWTAVGSGIVGKFGNSPEPEKRFHSLLPLYGFLGFCGVLIIRHLPFLAHLSPGEPPGYDAQVIAAALAFAPFNILGGYLFVQGARAFGKSSGNAPAGKAYACEALGAAIGGVMVSFLAYGFFSNTVIAFFCVLFGFGGNAWWNLSVKKPIGTAGLFPLAAAVLLLVLSPIASGGPANGLRLLKEQDTRYGRLRVTRTGDQVTFHANASVLFSTPDPERTEFTAHLPMLLAQNPHRVLIIGGGPGGILDEVLRYETVTEIVSVELDPAIFSLSSRFLPEKWRADRRVRTVNADGRAFLLAGGEKFDVIIMDMPEPSSGGANRYYTEEYFRLVSEHLFHGGIFSFSLNGSENYVSTDLASFLATIRASLETVFPSVAVLPGDQARFLAGIAPEMFAGIGWEWFEKARENYGFELSFVRDYYLRYMFSPEQISSLGAALDAVDSPAVNTDTRPVAYAKLTLLQGDLENSALIRSIAPLLNLRTVLGLMLFMVAAIFLAGWLPGISRAGWPIAAAVAALGFTTISLEVLAILAYQSKFGLLYGKIALLTGSYMAGLAIGSLRGMRLLSSHREGIGALALIQGGIGVVSLAWICLLGTFGGTGGAGLVQESGFFLLTAGAGVAGGIQFPLADTLFRRARIPRPTGFGLIYACDLAGASLGALMTASFLIPVAGMILTLSYFVLLNAGITILLWFRR